MDGVRPRVRAPRVRPALAAAAALTALAGAAAPATAQATCPDTRRVPSQSNVDEVREATECLINAQRAARDLRPLRIVAALRRAADRHSEDMVRRDYFSHASRNGASPSERLKRAGWRPRGSWTAGENIGWGTGVLGDAQSIVHAWMNSPGHRANILSPRFRELGVGVAVGVPGSGRRGGTYTADFAAS